MLNEAMNVRARIGLQSKCQRTTWQNQPRPL